MQSNPNNTEIPMGFGMALAMDMSAMSYFSSLAPADQKALISRAHTIQSKEEMQQFVHSLGTYRTPFF